MRSSSNARRREKKIVLIEKLNPRWQDLAEKDLAGEAGLRAEPAVSDAKQLLADGESPAVWSVATETEEEMRFPGQSLGRTP